MRGVVGVIGKLGLNVGFSTVGFASRNSLSFLFFAAMSSTRRDRAKKKSGLLAFSGCELNSLTTSAIISGGVLKRTSVRAIRLILSLRQQNVARTLVSKVTSSTV